MMVTSEDKWLDKICLGASAKGAEYKSLQKNRKNLVVIRETRLKSVVKI